MLTEMGQEIFSVTAFRSNFFLACSAGRIFVLHQLSLCILKKPKICPDLGFRPFSGVENVLRATVASRSQDLDEAIIAYPDNEIDSNIKGNL